MYFSRVDMLTEELSDCCGAPMYSDMEICSDCKEHCSSTISMEEAEREFFGNKVSLKKMSGLSETVAQIKFLAQDKLIGKFFDTNCPIGF